MLIILYAGNFLHQKTLNYINIDHFSVAIILFPVNLCLKENIPNIDAHIYKTNLHKRKWTSILITAGENHVADRHTDGHKYL